MEKEIVSLIRLSMTPHVGPVTAKELIKYIGSAEEVLKSSETKLMRVAGVGPNIAREIFQNNLQERAVQEVRFIEKHGIDLYAFNSIHYPMRLKRCADSPVLLYAKGNASLESKHVIAMVGSRMATDYGRGICAEFIQEIKAYNPIIISGLAYGIDICAHKEALKAGLQTIAVVGHGLDRIYPSSHRQIAMDIIEQGALISEFHSEVKPDRENFPARNRIIAGMSDAVVVVEAREQGGALITAEMANSYNRDVFAFPGRVHDTQSKGCINLIRTNIAQVICNGREMIEAMAWDEISNVNIQRKLFINLNEEENSIVQYLIRQNMHTHFDDLLNYFEWKSSKLASVLLQLEFSGVIKSLPGKMYRLC
jgi:DNA processing protein